MAPEVSMKSEYSFKSDMFSLGLVLAGVSAATNVSAKGGKVGLGLRATPDGGGFVAKMFLDKHLAFIQA